MVVLLALLGCKPEPDATGEETIPQMSDRELLIRSSLDLRGIRPTVAEYERLEGGEDVDSLVDDYLTDPRLEERVTRLWGEIYLTRTEFYTLDVRTLGEQYTLEQYLESIGDEPPRMVGYIAAHDLPYTDLVLADWTVANEVIGTTYPTDYPAAETGWRQVHYTDGRPAAGVLATNGLWWRYTSTDSNANRKRANQISRILLCNDYLVRPIDFDRNVNLLDQQAIDDALRTNPACSNCHVSLDPLASYLYGFWSYNDNSVDDMIRYHPERELRWEDYSGIAPAYYGEPGYTLEDLGYQIASDDRFVSCAVEQAYELLLRRDSDLADTTELTKHRDAFLGGGLTLRPLLASVLRDPNYRAGATEVAGAVSKKIPTPDLLTSQIADLTGYRLTQNQRDALASDQNGYLTLAGGADGYFVTESATRPNATSQLVTERLAEAAAWHVMRHDIENPTAPLLFDAISPELTPAGDEAAFARQLQSLHFRLYGTRIEADGQEVAANRELWDAIYAVEHDPQMAWTAVVSALLRDPDFVLY